MMLRLKHKLWAGPKTEYGMEAMITNQKVNQTIEGPLVYTSKCCALHLTVTLAQGNWCCFFLKCAAASWMLQPPKC